MSYRGTGRERLQHLKTVLSCLVCTVLRVLTHDRDAKFEHRLGAEKILLSQIDASLFFAGTIGEYSVVLKSTDSFKIRSFARARNLSITNQQNITATSSTFSVVLSGRVSAIWAFCSRSKEAHISQQTTNGQLSFTKQIDALSVTWDKWRSSRGTGTA